MDKHVYVTNNSYNKLKSMYAGFISVVDDEVKRRVYKEDMSWILAIFDYKYLYAEILLLSNSDLVRIESPASSKSSDYIFDARGVPKYHYNRLCEFARKDYLNFEIPVEIKSRGLGEIEKFKRFAEDHKRLLYSDEEEFINKLGAQFRLKNPPKKITHPNSGVSEFSKLSLEEMQSAIDEHLCKARVFLDGHPRVKNYNFANSEFLKRLKLSDDDKQWHNFFKKVLKDMLKEYVRKRDGEEFALTKGFLDSLGFEGCKACGNELDL